MILEDHLMTRTDMTTKHKTAMTELPQFHSVIDTARSQRLAEATEEDARASQRVWALMTETQLNGIRSLTPQQRRVFGLLGDGLANKEIALRLGVHESTVKAHVSATFAKLGCRNRIKVALLALKFTLCCDQ